MFTTLATGFRGVVAVSPPPRVTPTQEIRFCRSADGVRIACAVHGSGPPLVIDACWMSHLQYDWQSPVWRHNLVELGKVATVIRFDERGHGLCDRDVDAGLDRFALMAMSQGGPVSVDCTVRHPKVGWARPDSAFRRVFTSLMIPEATEEQMVWLDDLQGGRFDRGTGSTVLDWEYLLVTGERG